jgi:hypothetical protein
MAGVTSRTLGTDECSAGPTEASRGITPAVGAVYKIMVKLQALMS